MLIRHDAVRDTVADIMKDVCHDVHVEPQLLPVTGEDLPPETCRADGARADISAVGLWQPLNRAFLDIKVVNPYAQTNAAMELGAMYRSHERQKKRKYNARIIEVEKGTFTPVVFSCSGVAAPEASRLLKTIALKRAAKRDEKYCTTINFIRRRIAFDVLRTCLLSFRGKRDSATGVLPIEDLDVEEREMEIY